MICFAVNGKHFESIGIGLCAQIFVNHSRLNVRIIGGTYLVSLQFDTFELKNHSSNMGPHKISQIVTKISHHICASKEIPTLISELQIMENNKS